MADTVSETERETTCKLSVTPAFTNGVELVCQQKSRPSSAGTASGLGASEVSGVPIPWMTRRAVNSSSNTTTTFPPPRCTRPASNRVSAHPSVAYRRPRTPSCVTTISRVLREG